MGDMFWWRTDEIFKGLSSVFGIANDILIIGYDANGRDHIRHWCEWSDIPVRKCKV